MDSLFRAQERSARNKMVASLMPREECVIENVNRRPIPDALVGAIYDGLAQEKPWVEGLDLLRVAMNANGVCLRISLKGANPREYLYAAGPQTTEESIAEWEARSARDHLPVELRPGEARIINWAEIAPAATLSHMLRRYDIATCAVMLIAAQDGVEYLLHASRSGSARGYDAEELAFFQRIGEHFGRALKLRQELVQAQVVSGFQSDALDRLGIAEILVGAHGQLMVLNQAARRMLADCEGLRIFGGRLRAADEHDDRVFQSILKDVLASETGDRSRAMLVKRGGEGRDLNLLVSARRSVSVVSGRSETCALVFLRRSSVASDVDVQLLREIFSFTRAEARLALGLAKGKRLEDVEAELNIRHNTARAHLRSMFVKADVNRQSELVHLLANCLAPLGRPQETLCVDA